MLAEYYLTLKSLHILSFIAWMAGLLYLPRLFIYHCEFEVGSKAYLTFCRMERRLLKIIMAPSMIMTYVFGVLLAIAVDAWPMGWFHIKILFVLVLSGYHGYLAKMAKSFSGGTYPSLSRRSLVVLNEVPFFLAILIVFLAVLKPW